jgi:glycosyltransferase involved in cell wall biosynthesis
VTPVRFSLNTQPSPKTIICIIPAYNEEKTIKNIVEQVRKFCSSVIVVNDGSQDNTREEAEKAGALVVEHVVNLGVGSSIETGFNVALRHGADVVISLDADAQHDPAEIPKLIEPILNKEADIVVGSRFLSGAEAMPLTKKVGNKILSWITSALSGYPITDSQCGYRAYSREVLRKLTLTQLPKDYSWASDTLAKARKYNFTIKEVPIKTIYNRNLKRAKGTDVFIGVKILIDILRSKLE